MPGRLSPQVLEILRGIPIGFAQVMLQPSRTVGLAFLAGVFWNSWAIASMGVLGCVAGTVTALLLSYPKDERQIGLYGFNGALVGLACAYFHQPSLLLMVLVIAGGMVSSVIMNRMLLMDLKPFTFPFVVVAWMIFGLLSTTGWSAATSGYAPPQQEIVAVDALLRGVGQVLFQESIITGLVFLLAIAARSRVQGIYAVLAVTMGLISAYAAGLPVDAANLGLFGYNGVLCAILFAGCRARDFASAVAAIALSIAVVRVFHVVELPAFTFPFVLSSWIVLAIRGYVWSPASGT